MPEICAEAAGSQNLSLHK